MPILSSPPESSSRVGVHEKFIYCKKHPVTGMRVEKKLVEKGWVALVGIPDILEISPDVFKFRSIRGNNLVKTFPVILSRHCDESWYHFHLFKNKESVQVMHFVQLCCHFISRICNKTSDW